MRSKRLLISAIASALLMIIVPACGSEDGASGSSDGTTVVTSTSVVGALVREVGGNLVTVQELIGPGADPHTFELTPGDARTVASADLMLLIGLELDEFLADSSGDDCPTVAIVSDGVELLEAGGGREHDTDHDDEHDHGDYDPHVWQDPVQVKVMVANIADALAEADPENAQTYRDNAAAYQTTLDETDRKINRLIDEIPEGRRKLVTNHDAFAYFAHRYGLEIVGTVIPGTSSEADPSASGIAELTTLIHEEGVTTIFAEELLDPKVAETLADDTGVEFVYGLYSEQVGEEGSGAETVHGMLLANAELISEALR